MSTFPKNHSFDKMEKTRCPNCGRNLTENEWYCYFCDVDILKLKKEKRSETKNPRKNR